MRRWNKSLLAKMGEALSVEFLQHQGYVLLAQNYYSAYGEIDLIMQDKSELVCVEVKTRTRHDLKSIENCITLPKKKRITKTAQFFIYKHPEFSNLSCRFDLMIVLHYHIDDAYKCIHYKNAFDPVFDETS